MSPTRWPAPEDAVAVVSVEAVREFAPELPLSASVEAVQPWITTERTAILEISLHNDGSKLYDPLAGGGDRRVFSTTASVGPPPKISLPTATDDDSSPLAARRTAAPEDACWRLQHHVGFPRSVRYSNTLPPESSVSLRVEVWGHHRNETCLPTGAFRFEDRYETSGEPRVSFDWGFRIRVSSVNGGLGLSNETTP